jgi:Tfp pilus assembly protein PilE
MALINCPDCGAQVSDTAVVCAQCGFPLRRELLMQGGAARGAKSGANTAAIVVGVVVAGFVGLVMIGILAALAIPRFAQATQRVKEKDGELLLKKLFTLENAYMANTGAYARTVEELSSVGWLPTDSARFYTPEITLSPAGDAIVCLDARPKRGGDVQPLSMDSVGVMYHDEGCAGETLRESRAASFQPPVPDDVPGEGGEAGARTLLREVWLGVAEYRAKEGRDPTQLGQVLRHVHFTRASNENRLVVGRSNGGVCVSAVGAGELSVDGEGRLYTGPTCSGAVLEQFEADAKPTGKPTS